MDLNAYLDAAEKAPGITTQVALARALGVTRQSIISWRVGLSSPRPETMLRLAQLAGVSPEIAMIDRMEWQADGVASRDIVARIRASIAGIAACILLFLFVFPPPISAETCAENPPCSLYYGNANLWKSVWIQLLAAGLR